MYNFSDDHELPPRLVFSLETRKASSHNTEKKNCGKIAINEALILNNVEYDLSSVICHHGKLISSGHFTVFIKKMGSWYHLDDDSCQKVVDTGKFFSAIASGSRYTAYIVVYSKNNTS